MREGGAGVGCGGVGPLGTPTVAIAGRTVSRGEARRSVLRVRPMGTAAKRDDEGLDRTRKVTGEEGA